MRRAEDGEFIASVREFLRLPEVLTTEQAAEFLQCSVEHLEIARTKGGGPPFSRLGPRLVRYRKAALLDYLAKREVTSTSAPK